MYVVTVMSYHLYLATSSTYNESNIKVRETGLEGQQMDIDCLHCHPIWHWYPLDLLLYYHPGG